jgi:type I restriction enzyme S subunit
MGESSDTSLPVVIGIGNFDYAGGFRFDSTTLKRFSGSFPAEYILEPGDVLLAMTCQTAGGEILGIPGTVPADGRTYLHNQRLGKLEIFRTDRVDLRYLYHVARSKPFNQHLFGTASGSKILHTSPGRIEDFNFDLPPHHEQLEIAAMLSVFDEKIESNRLLITLIPLLVHALVVTAIVRGSSTVAVAKLARFTNGGAYTKGASGTGRMVLRIAELNSGPGGSTVYSDIDVPEDKTARAGDILMSWSGSLGVYRWFRDEAIINQHIFKVIPTGYPSWLVFDRLGAVMPVFQGIAQDKTTTMGHIQRGHLESTTVHLPPPAEIERLESALAPLWERLLLAEQANVKLAGLRDALLPELISGRTRTRRAAEALA